MPKIFKEFILPHPKSDYEDFEWLPIVRPRGYRLPFGYEIDPNDPDILLPIKKELYLLEDAKKHCKKFSYKDVAVWLSEQSGRSISPEGLRKRVKSESRRKKRITNAEQLAERYRIAKEKAEALEKGSLGRRRRKDSSST